MDFYSFIAMLAEQRRLGRTMNYPNPHLHHPSFHQSGDMVAPNLPVLSATRRRQLLQQQQQQQQQLLQHQQQQQGAPVLSKFYSPPPFNLSRPNKSLEGHRVYTRDFLLKCSQDKFCLRQPLGWDRVLQNIPEICLEEVEQAFDSEEYRETTRSNRPSASTFGFRNFSPGSGEGVGIFGPPIGVHGLPVHRRSAEKLFSATGPTDAFDREKNEDMGGMCQPPHEVQAATSQSPPLPRTPPPLASLVVHLSPSEGDSPINCTGAGDSADQSLQSDEME